MSFEQNTLYPLKFAPILKEKVWGGDKIKSIYRHSVDEKSPIGESWELSALQNGDCEVINGFLAGNTLSELTEVYMGDLVGDGVYAKFGDVFPLLVKIIDARQQLSIQVHPNDDMVFGEEDGASGKNELWYVLDADAGACVVAGFEKPMSQADCADYIAHNELENVLHRIPVKKGDVVYVPAGCVHSIAAGCLILEIQQPSDITYRLYDFNRRDKDGNLRQLHIDKAVAAIDWENWKVDKLPVAAKTNDLSNIIDNEYFTVNLMDIDRPKEYELAAIDSFVVLTCTEGHVTIQFDGDFITLTDMESVLVPAEMTSLTLVPTVKSRLIETYIKV